MPLDEHINNVARRVEALRSRLASTLAGRDRFVLEIGCGHGHWLVAYAAAHPDRFCLGIDIAADRIERARRKADRAKLPNLSFERASAEDLFAALPDGHRLDDIFILFSDPWPKKRHWKNRVLRPDTLDRLGQRAAHGARIHFRTDSEDYFGWATEIASGHDLWAIETDEPWPFEYATVFQSRAQSYRSLILRRSEASPRERSTENRHRHELDQQGEAEQSEAEGVENVEGARGVR